MDIVGAKPGKGKAGAIRTRTSFLGLEIWLI